VVTVAESASAHHKKTPISKHFDAFQEHLRAKDTAETYRADTRRHLDQLAREQVSSHVNLHPRATAFLLNHEALVELLL
jgi:hypothetical protein